MIIYSHLELVNEVKTSLVEADYDVAEIHRSGTVDLIAKSNQDENEAALLTKCVSQLDNFKTQHSAQIQALSKFIGAIPLLIADCYKNNQFLRDETLYLRHNINAINLKTLQNLLEHNISPYKIAMRGSSVSIKLNGSKLTRAIDQIEHNKTKNEISKDLEISRQTLANYQTGQSLPSEETFQRIINFFNDMTSKVTKDDLIDPINLFKNKSLNENEKSNDTINEANLTGFRGEVNEKLKELQFNSKWFQSLPWDGVSIDQEIRSKKLLFFTGLGEKEQLDPLLARINATENVVRLFNNKSIWIIQNEKIIPDLQDLLLHGPSDIKILSFHNLPDIKKEKIKNLK